MSVVRTVTEIRAPIDRVFDLARSVDLHTQSARSTGEKAIEGVTSGLLGLGEHVTWRGRHLGIWQNLTSKITEFARPDHFRDSMVRGAFKRFDHDHFFEAKRDLTIMTDVFDFTSPLAVLGQIADALVLKRYLRQFLEERNAVIKRTAEGDDWNLYLSAAAPPADAG